MKSVFLSGGIENLRDSGSSWRKQATGMLNYDGYKVFNPVEDGLESSDDATVNEIVARNLYLQKQADIILVEYQIPSRAYIGTDFELNKAKEWDQPSIVWAHPVLAQRVYLKYLASRIFLTLGDCVEYIRMYYPNN